MMESGLVSISFRKLSVREIVELCVRSGLKLIEWGGDVHVPPGDRTAVETAAALMADHGLRCSSYGSYYRAGTPDRPPFEKIVETAEALGAPTIRVWAGNTGSAETDPAQRDAVVADLYQCCRLAAAAGMTVTTEFHGKTLTDTNESAELLFREVGDPQLRSGWQPAVGQSFEYRMAGLQTMLPVLSTLHVFQWDQPTVRRPLVEGAADWRRYLRTAADSGVDHAALLEFFMDDSPEQCVADAATLNGWLAEL